MSRLGVLRWLALSLREALRRLGSKAPSLKRGAQPAALGWLLVALALVLLTTSWWPFAIPLALAGVLLPGAKVLRLSLLEGFSDGLGWTDEKDGVK